MNKSPGTRTETLRTFFVLWRYRTSIDPYVNFRVPRSENDKSAEPKRIFLLFLSSFSSFEKAITRRAVFFHHIRRLDVVDENNIATNHQ